MTSGHAASCARLVVGAHDSADSVRWQSSATPSPETCRKLAASGCLIAADETAGDAGSLEIADVIYRRERLAGARSSAWLARILDRCPGCSVAAVPQAGRRYVVAARAGRPVIFSFAGTNGHGLNALVGAIFVHGWLCAGWPVDDLYPPRLHAAGTLRIPIGSATVPVSFRMFYEDLPEPASPDGPSSASRRLISPVSGASISE